MFPFPSPLLAVAAAGSSGVWTRIGTDVSAGGNTFGLSNATLRETFQSSIMLSGSQVRVTIYNADGSNPLIINDCFMQLNGSGGLDYSTTPIRALFSGANGATIPASGHLTCDPVTLTTTSSNQVTVGFNFGSPATLLARNGATGVNYGYKTSSQDAATVTASGYSSISTYTLMNMEILH